MRLKELKAIGAWDLRKLAARLGVYKVDQSRPDRIKAIWAKVKYPKPINFNKPLPPVPGWSDFCKRMGCKDQTQERGMK